MTDEIKPALTTEGWHDLTRNRVAHVGSLSLEIIHPDSGGGLAIADDSADVVEIDPSELSAVAAACIGAMGAGDPNKITRMDVLVVEHAGHYAGNGDGVMTGERLDALLALAAKLAALLPPE